MMLERRIDAQRRESARYHTRQCKIIATLTRGRHVTQTNERLRFGPRCTLLVNCNAIPRRFPNRRCLKYTTVFSLYERTTTRHYFATFVSHFILGVDVFTLHRCRLIPKYYPLNIDSCTYTHSFFNTFATETFGAGGILFSGMSVRELSLRLRVSL